MRQGRRSTRSGTTTRFPPADDPVRIAPETLSALPDALRAAQRVFDSTGGLHAAGLFTAAASCSCAREDVGRHNAVDKVHRLGAAGRAGSRSRHAC